MYSWKTIRTVAAVLLLLPLIHLAVIVSKETTRSLNSSPNAWASEVIKYAKIDQRSTMPSDPIVIVGGRRVSLWRDLEDLLAPMPVLTRGLGDATTDDIIYYYENLIGFYRPHTVVLLPGESEFHIRDNKSADELVAAIQKLVKLDLSHGITRQFYIFSVLKTPLYPSNNSKIEESTQALQSWAASIESVEIIDANTLLADRKGKAKPGYFRNDGVNLNDSGYVRLSMMLRAQLERDNPAIYGLAGTL
jgi:hypothetical protein